MPTKRGQPPPIDKGWAWVIVFGVFLHLFSMMGLSKSSGLIVRALVVHFEIPVAEAVVPSTISSASFAFFCPVAVVVGDAFSVRKVVIAGSVLAFVGVSLGSLLINLPFFACFYGLSSGIGFACFYGNGIRLLGNYFRRHRTLANGLALSGSSIGQFIWPFLIEFLLDKYGLQGTMLVISAIFLHGAVSGALFRPIDLDVDDRQASNEIANGQHNIQEHQENGGHFIESCDLLEAQERSCQNAIVELPTDNTPPRNDSMFHCELRSAALTSRAQQGVLHPLNNDETSTHDSVTSQQEPLTSNAFRNPENPPSLSNVSIPISTTNTVKTNGFTQRLVNSFDFRVLKNYVSVFYALVSFFCFIGYFSTVLFLPYIYADRRMQSENISKLMSICGVGELIARLTIGILADRDFIQRYKLLAIASYSCCLNIFMLYFAETLVWAGVHSALYGFFGGSYVCLSAVVLLDLVGLSDFSKNLAVVLLIQGGGVGISQPLLGSLRDATGNCNAIIFICAGSMLVGGTLMLAYPLVRRLEQRRQGQGQRRKADA